MIPNLPRPFLWTEKTLIQAFFDEESLSERFYITVNKLIDINLLPCLDYLELFNELYYQLTRYYYEKPNINDYQRYYNDIKNNLGQDLYADLVMTMMFHYCRLYENNFVKEKDSFMIFIEIKQAKNVYWNYFKLIPPAAISWVKNIRYPNSPTPVPPEMLSKMKLDWNRITQNFNTKVIKELLDLWKKKAEKKAISGIIMSNYLLISGFDCDKHLSLAVFFSKVLNSQNEKLASSEIDDNNSSENKEFVEAAKYISEYNRKKVKWGGDENVNISKPTPRVIVTSRTSKGGMTHTFKIVDDKTQDKTKDESEIKDKEIVQLKKERDEYKKKVNELEKRIKESEKRHEEDINRMTTGFGALVLEEIEDGEVVSRQLLNRDVNQALAESQRQQKLSQQQLKEMESQIANLRDKLGNTTIPLKSLAEGIKRYAKLYGLEKGKGLLLSLSFILKKEHVWTDNAESLENFFIKAEEENKKPTLSLTNEKGGIVQISENK